ncbi:MAG TPA: Arm DNA-binding domain-containing protein, partial [Rhizomicrobium sp.]|nr:Arm DNA-binding domain-containing protein [Rhizomicrobium sp.]
MRLTEYTIKSLQAPPKGEKIYADAVLAGFGVRVSAGGTKSFVLTHGKLRRRQTIGRVGILTLHQARDAAKKILAAYTLGKTEAPSIAWKDGVA